MKKEILDALKAKFEGVSDSILNRVADKLAKTVTTAEQITTAVEGVTFQQVLESYGDSRATEAQHTAVRNYESKYGLKDGAKVEPGATINEPEDGGNDVPEWAQALINTNKQLTERLNKMEGDQTTNARKQQISSITDRLPERLRKAYDRTPVDTLSEEEFSGLLEEITTEVEGIVTETKTKGAVFGRPAVNSGGNKGNELTEEQRDAIIKRDDAPGNDGQPF